MFTNILICPITIDNISALKFTSKIKILLHNKTLKKSYSHHPTKPTPLFSSLLLRDFCF